MATPGKPLGGKAAMAGAKAAISKAAVGKAAFYGGGGLLAFAGKRALWPAFAIGGIFSSAAWFGVFDLSWSFVKWPFPIPPNPDASARFTGILTLPLTVVASVWIGKLTCPEMAPPPASIVDTAGLFKYVQSVPLKHFGMVGAGSAVMAAITCRAVQWRGGA